MADPATRGSWKILPLPMERERLELAISLTDGEGERVRRGHIPQDMDDKWFVFFEDGWLYFHRSWTGYCIFALRLEGSPNGVRIIDGWVSRDANQYTSTDIEFDRRTVQQLIQSRLLV